MGDEEVGERNEACAVCSEREWPKQREVRESMEERLSTFVRPGSSL